MISSTELAAIVRAYNPNADFERLDAAYEYGRRMHDGQKRHSGEEYFMHPVAVAAILAEQRLDDDTVITALLHDTLEDTGSTYTELTERFGLGVAELVNGVTNLTNLQLSSHQTKQAENFRKLFMAMSKDMRVILVKLADRLHNMRTIKHMKPEKQVKKARETMEIYAPLAGRMGMQWMREELEDLSFKVLNPEGRQSILRRFVSLQRETGDVVVKITADIEYELDRKGIIADVYGRAKKPYSIWRKMEEKKQSFSRLSDIYGFRIITNSEDDCYAVLGALHTRWSAVPGRFKDYISQPKSNGYRSIHTTVSGRDGKRVEMQIRTHQMHEVAEGGVAAHWSYRDGVQEENPFAVDPSSWIDSVTDRLSDGEDHSEFLEHVKLEMYADKVFCFTPKGDVIKLPKGATPLDYAYGIHTRIGDSCVGAKVDGLRVPLWTRLRNGQSVEIITAEGQRPQATWIDIVTTGRAKTAIRRSLREEDRARFIKLGRELARVGFENVGKRATEKALKTAANLLGEADGDNLLEKLGTAELTTGAVLSALYPELEGLHAEEVLPDKAVIGLDPDQPFQRADCCQPVPGERIVGITWRGKGVMVHTIDCNALSEFESSSARWVDLHWQPGQHATAHGVSLNIVMGNDPGVLGRICTLIGEQRANISDVEFVDRKPDFFRILMSVEVRDLEHLHRVMTVVDADSDVAELTRHKDLARAPS